MTHSRIQTTGSYLPQKVLTNQDLERMVETSDEWIRERTGIVSRHIAADDESTVDLAAHAARNAMEAGNFSPADIDLILVATTTPDRIFPSTACLLQERLGIHGCPAFDLQAVCTGFVYALDVADRFIRTGGARCALVVGAEALSRIIDWTDRNTCVLFGDGAGAVIVTASDEPGILSSHLHADGAFKELLTVPTGVASLPHVRESEGQYIQMQGSEVFKIAVNTLGRVVEETLATNGLERGSVDWLIPHQANIRIIAATARKLHLPMERVVTTIAEHGNTSAASVPLALDVAVRDGRIRRDELVLFEAFGGGFTWGSVLLRW